jgi:hypothetical protein
MLAQQAGSVVRAEELLKRGTAVQVELFPLCADPAGVGLIAGADDDEVLRG